MTDHQLSGSPARRPLPRRVAPLSLRINRVVWHTLRVPLAADFRYDPGIPLTVSVTFRPPEGPRVTWRIGRDLLLDGLMEATGDGDVRIWPLRGRSRWKVCLRLRSRGAQALFEADLGALETWLRGTYDVVPYGTELAGVDWDALVAELSEGG
ncbi:SsgA family sporulation/cell division regulator [Streptomyces sp. NPDC006997]|uniref:SsgA family sporulation/cell division regulator n=1 Tax=Streptomyces sp. NPDC006997 TaxID=3155356 RepID=UPI0033CCB394